MVSLVSFFPLNASAWQIAWSSDLPSPTFRIYVDGVLVLTTTLTQATIAISPGDSPVIEILDDPTATPTPAYPSQVLLTWLAVSGAASYSVDQYVGSTWNNLAQVAEDGSAVFSWESGAQPDGQTATFRIVPIGENGNSGTALSFAKLVVRFPDPPAVTMSYNAAAAQVTIAAA